MALFRRNRNEPSGETVDLDDPELAELAELEQLEALERAEAAERAEADGPPQQDEGGAVS